MAVLTAATTATDAAANAVPMAKMRLPLGRRRPGWAAVLLDLIADLHWSNRSGAAVTPR
jgi:hypothetical protein